MATSRSRARARRAAPGPARVVADDTWAGDWIEYLTGDREIVEKSTSSLRVLDLFSGVGGLALGFARAAAAQRLELDSTGAVDLDPRALAVYTANHQTAHPMCRSVGSIVDFQVRGAGETARFLYEPEMLGGAAEAFTGNVDVVVAGPPCQGHSTLNNNTRGDDPRNRLYLTVPAIAVATGAPVVVIENVPAVRSSRGNVVATTAALLEYSGYSVTAAVLGADELGWPQTRRRYFLVARRDRPPIPIETIRDRLRREPLPISWAIGDLLEDPLAQMSLEHPMRGVAEMSSENAERITWLFEHDQFDMPNHLRPDCHKDGTTYGAVYGRMRWDRPAPTLTTGFLTPGRGRFIHPLRKRTLTPHEAARLQGFPDWFDFWPPGTDEPTRKDLVAWIGNAVPTILGYAAGLSALA